MDIRQVLNKVIDKTELDPLEAEAAMRGIMTGELTSAQIGALLTALRIKGETVGEIAGFAREMRNQAEKITTVRHQLIDTCGTGGDGSLTFNISTAVAFVVAGAGMAVAKHGNRSVSSRCGSADVLEALGVKIDMSPVQVGQCLDAVGIAFLFAPVFHQAMKHVVGPRQEIGIRTVFNILGPLSNPAGAEVQLVGVYDANLTQVMAEVLHNLGTKRAMVVHGEDGLDEITCCGSTQISELKDGKISTYHINPSDFGLGIAQRTEIIGGDAQANAQIVLDILQGTAGACRDIVLMNSAAALYVSGLAADLMEGMVLARASIDSGKAYGKLMELKKAAVAC